MKRVLVMPKSLMALALVLVAASALFRFPQTDSFQVIIISLVATIAFDYLFIRARKIPPFVLNAALVSGLIIGLLTSPQAPWYVPVFTSAVAMFLKNFLRIDGAHIFNPAAAGLLLAGLTFKQDIFWWAASYQQDLLPILLLLTPAFVSAYYMKRYMIIVPFLLTYALAHQVFFDPTVLFFAIVMLPEPKTSPNGFVKQAGYGVFVAVLTKFIFFIDPLIASLMLGNLLTYALKKY